MTLLESVLALDQWLETMKQPQGYAGPVAHWWQACYQYVGPGLDWRYEGILAGYQRLWDLSRDERWRRRIDEAVGHLIAGQRPDGSYRNSRFEDNPGVLGTPHEAAATLGLLHVCRTATHPDLRYAVVKSLNHLIDCLWDKPSQGFNDAPGVLGRVPNKLATLAEVLMAGAEWLGEESWLAYARSALDDIVRFQVKAGRYQGAVHQWATGPALTGDGRFFPYYIARCVPALVEGARIFHAPSYREAAELIGDFLLRTRHDDGSWPQLLYQHGGGVEYPHWVAPLADILYALWCLGRPLPAASLAYLRQGQLPSGGFVTAEGFCARFDGRRRPARSYLDVTPVVGWNDKVLRLLTALLSDRPEGWPRVPIADEATVVPVWVDQEVGQFRETPEAMAIGGKRGLAFFWEKKASWAVLRGEVMVR
ncbi:MAG: hypothetical protein OWU84_06180 [Firmicutes bacterium]|nr:hypothetical protein [Bacillota bacterium]